MLQRKMPTGAITPGRNPLLRLAVITAEFHGTVPGEVAASFPSFFDIPENETLQFMTQNMLCLGTPSDGRNGTRNTIYCQ